MRSIHLQLQNNSSMQFAYFHGKSFSSLNSLSISNLSALKLIICENASFKNTNTIELSSNFLMIL